MNQPFIAPAFLSLSPAKRARNLRRGLLLSGATGVALSMNVLPAHAQSSASSALVNAPSNPVAARAALNRAHAQEAAGSVALAAAQFRDALALAPKDASVARELARFYSRQNRFEEAVAQWKNVTLLKSGDAEATRELARVSRLVPLHAELSGTGVADVAPLPPAFTPRLQTRSFAQAITRANGSPMTGASTTRINTSSSDIGPLGDAPVSDAILLAQNVDASNAPLENGPLSLPSAPDAPEPEAPMPEGYATSVPVAAKPRAARPASVRLTPTPFQLPARRSVYVGEKLQAAAWPYVNRGAKLLQDDSNNPRPRAEQLRRARAALAQYQAAERIDPTNPYAAPGVATSQLILGNFDESAAASLRVLSIPLNSPPRRATAKQRADIRQQQNDMVTKSLRELADALTYAQSPTDRSYGHYRRALGVNNFILGRTPGAIESEYQNAKIFTYVGDYSAANAAFTRAHNLDRKRADILADWGLALSYNNDPQAITTLLDGLREQPDNFRLTLALANSYYYFGKYDLAEPRFRSILSLQPSNKEALVGLADSLAFTNRPNEAIPYYVRALNGRKTGNDKASLGLGRALVFAGRYKEGATNLNSFLVSHPNNVPALEALAIAQVRTKSPNAENSYRKLLKLQTKPTALAQTRASIGDLQLSRLDLAGATESYRQAIKLAPSKFEFRLVYAQLLSYSGNQWPATAVAVRQAIAVSPKNARNPQLLALQLQTALKTGDEATYRQLAEELKTTQPGSAQDSLTLAQALRDAGNREASDRLLDLSAAQVKDPETLLKLADATRDARFYDKSFVLYQRLLRNERLSRSNLTPADAALKAQGVLGFTTARLYSNDYAGANALLPTLQGVTNSLPAQQRARAFFIEASVDLGLDTPESRDNAARLANQILGTLDPKDSSNDLAIADARTILGRFLVRRGLFADAVPQFREALQRNPNSGDINEELAETLAASNDIDAAIVEFKQLIARTNNATPRLKLAQLLLDKERYAEAEELFKEVLAQRLAGGRTLLPSVQRALASNSLLELSPLAGLDFPSTRGAALLNPRSSNRRVAVNPVALKNNRRRFAQNETSSGPVSPTTGIEPGAGVETLPDTPSVTSIDPNPVTTLPSTPLEGATDGTGATTAPPLQGAPATPSAPDTPGTPATPNATAAPGTPTTSNPQIVDETPDPNADPFAPQLLPDIDSPLRRGDLATANRGLGESRLRQGQTREAVEYFTQAINLLPNDFRAYTGRARALRAAGEFQLALQDANRARDIDKVDLPTGVIQAQLLADTGSVPEATTALNALIAQIETAPTRPENPRLDTPDNYAQIALGFNSIKDFSTSLALLDRSDTRNPGDKSLQRLRAETLGLSGQTEASLAAYDVAITAAQSDADPAKGKSRAVEALIGKARVYNYADDLPNAEATYRSALELASTNTTAQGELADVLTRRGNYAEANEFYKLAIAAKPDDLQTQINLARLQRRAGESANAINTLTGILSVSPNYVDALIERGGIRGSTGDFTGAEDDLNLSKENLRPTQAQLTAAQLETARVASYSGNFNRAIGLYNAILQTNPDNLQARVELAQNLGYADRTAEALAEVDSVLAKSPETSVKTLALTTQAGIFARTDRTEEALAIYKTLMDADPKNASLRMSRADAFFYGRRYPEAIDLYKQIASAEPANATVRARLGDALLYARRYPEAIALYDQILADPNNTNARDNTATSISRARALSYSGRSRDAVSSLRAIVDADKTNLTARLALAETGANSGNATLQRDAIGEYRSILNDLRSNPTSNQDPQLELNAQLGLARVLAYRGNYSESETILTSVLNANPANQDARIALADTQRFAGDNFEASKNYRLALTTGNLTPNQIASLNSTIGNLNRATSPSVGANISHYDDTNDIHLDSVGQSGILRTRALTLGILASQGRFRQNQLARRNRNEVGVLLGRQFGPVSARIIVSRLKYSGVSNKTLFNLSLNRDFSPRRRVNVSYARRDIFETDLAVGSGITANIANLTGSIPLGKRFDLDLSVTHYDYSDNNTRITASPALMFRLKGANPTLRVGLGYTYDNADQRRDAPFVYYTPQNFSAASVLADYIVTSGRTRYGISGGIPLTTSTGDNNVDRPADTLFGFLERDLGDNLSFNVRGGIVRVPSGTFRSNQFSGGLDYSF